MAGESRFFPSPFASKCRTLNHELPVPFDSPDGPCPSPPLRCAPATVGTAAMTAPLPAHEIRSLRFNGTSRAPFSFNSMYRIAFSASHDAGRIRAVPNETQPPRVPGLLSSEEGAPMATAKLLMIVGDY